MTRLDDALRAREALDRSLLIQQQGPAWITVMAAAAHHADKSTSEVNDLMLSIAGEALRYVRDHPVVEQVAA